MRKFHCYLTSCCVADCSKNRWQGVPGITTNDVQFTADILNHVSTLYCIDPARVSATGKSDGAGFCNILACDPVLSTRIAAFAPVSGAYYIPSRPCDPSFVAIPCDAARDSIPLLAFHGGNDTTISYSGGRRDGECLPTIPHFINQWARRDGLSEKNVTTSLAKNAVWYRYGEGSDAGLVGLVFESDIGHDWPSTAPNADNEVNGHHVASFNATPIILNFFARHPLV
jgi:poly(3-hydroxybutyrate) depolymerase